VTGWTDLAAALADELTALGKLRSPQWQAAVRAVPRHELVPVHHTLDPHTGQWTMQRTTLAQAYSNNALFVLPGGLSSTSMPGLMTRMLESLDVHDGHRVLEIGAGTGYNTALLCHRLGDDLVFAVDLEPELIELARSRLAAIGHHPTLVAADGTGGLAEHAPYDRIIATCSVPAVPWPWVEQIRDGGLILVDVKPGRLAGNLVLLRRDGDRAQGRFDPVHGSFMAMRRPGDTYRSAAGFPQRRSDARQRTSWLDLTRPWENTPFWFFTHFALPPGTSFSLRADSDAGPPTNTVLAAPDDSWCEVRETTTDGTHQVWEAGPHALWRIIEERHAWWQALGEPGWDRFGLTVTAAHQWAWLDTPDGEHTWNLTA
jgi:protein-L-isoaspartate(D-aspartate) O-methyltransferase